MKRAVWTMLAMLFVIAAMFLAFSSTDCVMQDHAAVSADASFRHLAGTDALGRDRAVRLAAAAVFTLLVATGVAALNTAVALLLGLRGPAASSPAGDARKYAADLLLSLPWLFLLVLLQAAVPFPMPLGRSAGIVILLLIFLGWPAYVRSLHQRARGMFAVKWRQQAKVWGVRFPAIVLRHFEAKAGPLFRAQLLLCLPAGILAQVYLGSFGFRIREPFVSWASMLQELNRPAEADVIQWVYLPLALCVLLLLTLELLTMDDNDFEITTAHRL